MMNAQKSAQEWQQTHKIADVEVIVTQSGFRVEKGGARFRYEAKRVPSLGDLADYLGVTPEDDLLRILSVIPRARSNEYLLEGKITDEKFHSRTYSQILPFLRTYLGQQNSTLTVVGDALTVGIETHYSPPAKAGARGRLEVVVDDPMREILHPEIGGDKFYKKSFFDIEHKWLENRPSLGTIAREQEAERMRESGLKRDAVRKAFTELHVDAAYTEFMRANYARLRHSGKSRVEKTLLDYLGR